MKKQNENVKKLVYVNVIRGDYVDTDTVTANEYAARYADYTIIEEEETDTQIIRIIKRGG